MLFDFSDRVPGQVLVQLGDNASLHVGGNALRNSASVLGGATTMSAFALLVRTTCSKAAATVRANRCSSISCQSVGSTALLRPATAASLNRPGRSLPCSWVGGFSASNTFSVLRFGDLASPSFHRNKAFRPSPTNTKPLCGISTMFVRSSEAARRGRNSRLSAIMPTTVTPQICSTDRIEGAIA